MALQSYYSCLCVSCSNWAGWPPVTAEEQSSQPALSLLQCLEQSEGGRLCLDDGRRDVGKGWKVLPIAFVCTVRSSKDQSCLVRCQPKLMNEQPNRQPRLRLQYVCWLHRHCTSWFVVVQQNWAGIKDDFIAPPLFAVRKNIIAGIVVTHCLVCTCLFAIVFSGRK